MGETLLVNHEGMLQMLDLWLLYQDFSLCNVSGLPPVTALEVERFKDMQHAHCEKIVQLLKKKWFPAVLDIFRRESSADKPDGAATLVVKRAGEARVEVTERGVHQRQPLLRAGEPTHEHVDHRTVE